MPIGDLSGVIAAAVTPVGKSFEVDSDRLGRHVAYLLNQGCSFVSVFGTTGEGASLSTRQKVASLDALKALGISPDKLLPAVMTPSIDEAAGMLAAIARLRCRGALVLPPFFYNDPSQEGMIGYFEEILRRAGNPDIDLLLYNIPQFSGVSYTVDLVTALVSKFGSAIAGIKDSTGDEANSVSLVKHFPEISVFTGDDRVMPGLLAAGGAGMIGGMPNLFAEDLCKIFEYPQAAETATLREQEAERIEIVEASGSLTAIKAALATRYRDDVWSRPIPPLTALSPQRIEALVAALAETGYRPEEGK